MGRRLTSTPFDRGREPARAEGGDSAGCVSPRARIGVGADHPHSFHLETCAGRFAGRDWVEPSPHVVATLANRSKPSSKEDEPGHGERTRCEVKPRCAHCGIPPGDGVQGRSRPTTDTVTARCRASAPMGGTPAIGLRCAAAKRLARILRLQVIHQRGHADRLGARIPHGPAQR